MVNSRVNHLVKSVQCALSDILILSTLEIYNYLLVGIRTRGILTSNHHTCIATWNMRTLFSTGKLAHVVKEMNTFHLAILGVSEMRWTGADKLISEDVTVLYSGGNKHERGVGILLNKEVSGGIMSWEPVNNRIITVRLRHVS